MHHEIDHKNIDQNIDEVLSALGNATPPAGMNARLLQAIHQADATPRANISARYLWLPISLAASLLLLTALLLHQHPQTNTNHAASPNRIHPTINPRPIHTRSPQPHRISSPRNTARSTGKIQDHSVPLQISHPAPPAPLTAQEQLLLQLARNDDPRQLALLNSDLQEQQFEALKKSFEDSITQSNNTTGESQ